MIPTLIQGAAMAVFFVPLVTLSACLASRPSRIPAASGLFNFARITAGSFGTSIATTFWDRRASLHHAQLVERITTLRSVVDAGACQHAIERDESATELRDDEPHHRPAGVHAVGQRYLLCLGDRVPALDRRGVARASGEARRETPSAPRARTSDSGYFCGRELGEPRNIDLRQRAGQRVGVHARTADGPRRIDPPPAPTPRRSWRGGCIPRERAGRRRGACARNRNPFPFPCSDRTSARGRRAPTASRCRRFRFRSSGSRRRCSAPSRWSPLIPIASPL